MGLVAKTPGPGEGPPPGPSGAGALILTDEGGTLRIANSNTTIGYLRYATEPPAIEYIFVHPAFRRQGHAARLVRALEAKLGRPCPPEPPLSPLGQAFFRAMERL